MSVRDEGIGIDPEDQDRIFDISKQVHSRHESSGTGIGIALYQRILERHAVKSGSIPSPEWIRVFVSTPCGWRSKRVGSSPLKQ
ncbi:ATP-binding protein [Halopiger xanaduensis]|uniref:ATP-binding protein n=1 Tax=Halopiger xanaduensis TaxID=387343 RepID=UPI00373FC997